MVEDLPCVAFCLAIDFFLAASTVVSLAIGITVGSTTVGVVVLLPNNPDILAPYDNSSSIVVVKMLLFAARFLFCAADNIDSPANLFSLFSSYVKTVSGA